MNKNCIILKIKLVPAHWADFPGENEVWPVIQDYDAPCSRYTEAEAAAEVDKLNRENRENPASRYQFVTLAP